MIFLKKRVISFCLTVNLLFLCLFGRLWSLSIYPKEVNVNPSVRTKEIAVRRGYIYARDMTPLVNNKTSYKILIQPTREAKIFFENDIVKESLNKGYFTTKNSETPVNELPESIKSMPVFSRYGDTVALHILGYIDGEGNGVSGIEKYYNDDLKKTGGKLSVSYSVDGLGHHLTGEKTEIYDNGYYGKGGIILTIEKQIQKIAENALTVNKITKGCIVILDTKTNEILACASSPTFDRSNISSNMNDKDSPFINRAFESYPIGSVFKVVTACAAFENGVNLQNFNCTGSIVKSKKYFRCSELDGHNNVDFYSAMANSCNPYFIELGNMIGGERLINTTKALGFGKSTDFGNGYRTDAGILPDTNELNSEAAIGNVSFGQGRLTGTPIQIATLMSVIANKGIYKEPALIKGFVDGEGKTTFNTPKTEKQVLKESTCQIIGKALLKTVEEGTGVKALSPIVNICGKTSTAQSGQYDESGNEIKYCWFAGYFPCENPQYTVCVLKENGTAGGTDCAPTVRYIAERVISLR